MNETLTDQEQSLFHQNTNSFADLDEPNSSFEDVNNGSMALLTSNPSASIDARMIYGQSPVVFGDATEIIFPNDPAIVLNVEDFGATGDGVTDDTEAIQSAIYEAASSNRVLYFPNGTYRLTQEIRFEREDSRPLRVGPYLYGQSRDGVILKLDDNLPAFSDPENPIRAVIRTVNAEDDATFREISADFFNRQMTNFTIDTGDNPGAVGIKFYSNNTGILKNVRIVGNGAIGVDLASIALNGPNLMQNIEIDGFDVGVQASGGNSATISNLTVRNAPIFGLSHTSGVLQVEGLVVENAPVAVFSAPTSRFGRTTLTLINGQLSGRDASQPAIISGDILFARNIEATGYVRAIEASAGTVGNIDALVVDEYSSHGVSKELMANADTSLNLPIRYMPITYDTNPQNWVNVQTYGAIPGDNIDDTQAIQAAVDAAAAAGHTTLYFPGSSSLDPNWYTVNEDVTIYGTVQHVMGFAPARILGDGRFRVIDDAAGAETVQFQGFNFTTVGYENASSRTMVLQNLTGSVQVTGTGETYLSSVAGQLSIENPEAKVWARQLNTERPDEVNVLNNGGTLWILGQKTETGGLKAQILNGAKTEILGAYIYSLGEGDFNTLYEIVDSEASFAGIRERTGTAKFLNFVQETRNGQTLVFSEDKLPTGNEFNRGISLYSASTLTFEQEPLATAQNVLSSISEQNLNESNRPIEEYLEQHELLDNIKNSVLDEDRTTEVKDLIFIQKSDWFSKINTTSSDINIPISSSESYSHNTLNMIEEYSFNGVQIAMDVTNSVF